MDQERVEYKLPLRLAPRRSHIIGQFVFMLAWCAFIVYWAYEFLPDYVASNGMPTLETLSFDDLMPALPALMLLVGLYSLSRLVLQVLPGSDLVHFVIDRDGLRRRQFGTRQEIRWADIRRISIIRRRAGKSTKRVLLIEGKEDRPVRDDESARYTAASFALDIDGYLPAFSNEEKAGKVSAWFNELLHQASEGALTDRVRVPGLLVPSVSAGPATARASGVTKNAPSRNSVIER